MQKLLEIPPVDRKIPIYLFPFPDQQQTLSYANVKPNAGKCGAQGLHNTVRYILG